MDNKGDCGRGQDRERKKMETLVLVGFGEKKPKEMNGCGGSRPKEAGDRDGHEEEEEEEEARARVRVLRPERMLATERVRGRVLCSTSRYNKIKCMCVCMSSF